MAENIKRKNEIARLAREELAREQADVFAFADKNHEIVELPPGLENGLTLKRKRGARTDTSCINEICEIVAQGITATAIFIDKCEHVSLLASKLSTCKWRPSGPRRNKSLYRTIRPMASGLVTKIEPWPLARLIPYARNARTHCEDQVAGPLRRGFFFWLNATSGLASM